MDQGGKITEEFRHKRVHLILMVAFLAFLGVALNNLFFGNDRIDLAIYGIGLVILAVSFHWLKRNKVDKAAAFMLWVITSICMSLIGLNAGLHDTGILAFPGILIIAAMIGSRRLFLSLFIAITLFVFALGFAIIAKWVSYDSMQETTSESMFDIVIVNSAIAFCVWLLSNDLKSLLVSLEKENQLVRDSQDQITHIARHDILTGLPNRALYEEYFYQSLARFMRTQERFALIFIDIDNFKTINDSFGHAAGDTLLIEIAHRLQANTRSNDRLSRLGGDEFALTIENVSNNDAISQIVMKLQEIISQPITIGNTDVNCTCSIGISICPDDANNFSDLRKKADMAMYKAKDAGRNTFCFYDNAMNTEVNEYLSLVSGLRHAIAHREFQLFFQPKHEIHSGNIIGAEALIRWYPATGSPIPPNIFIPIAESTGLIIEIGEWVLHQACQECKRWHDMGYTDFTIAVNMSYVQFKRGNITALIMHALQQSGLPPHALELELTESLLIDDASNIKQQLQHLRSMGVAIAIDDFGTGYSNLGYLNKFAIGTLKIDQSFVRNLTQHGHDKAIVRAIIQIANSLDMKTVAEGVEDIETLALLQELECDYFQGYLRAPALNPTAFIEYTSKCFKLEE